MTSWNVVNASILRASREAMGGFRSSPGVSAAPNIPSDVRSIDLVPFPIIQTHFPHGDGRIRDLGHLEDDVARGARPLHQSSQASPAGWSATIVRPPRARLASA